MLVHDFILIECIGFEFKLVFEFNQFEFGLKIEETKRNRKTQTL